MLLRGGEPVALTPKVFETLVYLVEHRGKVLSKDELMSAIWPDTVVEENNLGQNISRLRAVLGERPSEHRFIATVPGRGYRFVADVTLLASGGVIESAVPELPESESLQEDVVPADPLLPLTPAGRTRRRVWGVALAAALVTLLSVGAVALWRAQSRTPVAPPIRSVAILPFKPLVPENRDEALELGVADALITKLSHSREITVLPISSVRKYGDVAADPVAAGRELGVEAVLDGTIQRSGDRIRVTARLIRVADATTLWVGQFDGRFSDIFDVQDAISEHVVGELAVKLTSDERAFLAKRYTADAEAYELYLKGRFFWNKRTREGSAQAAQYFQKALERDPTYALAYAGLADCYRAQPMMSDVPSAEAFPKAKKAALDALAIDDRLAEAHTALGWIALFYDWDWGGAEQEFRLAIEINPNDPLAHLGYAHLMSILGRDDEALTAADRALKLEPLSPFLGALKGQFLFHARRYPQGIDHANRILEVDPGFWIGQLMLGKNLEREGRYDDALEAFRKAREFSGGNSEAISLAGYTDAVSGRRGEAERALAELQALEGRQYVPPYNVAMVHLGLGRSDEVFRWLERGYGERDVHMIFLGADPKWDAVREDPRFVDLAKRLNLPG